MAQGYVANVEIVRESVLDVARAEYRLRAARAQIDPVGFQVGPKDFPTIQPLWNAKNEAVNALTGGVLNAASGRVRARAVQTAYAVAKAGKPVDTAKLDTVIRGILALG